MLNTSPTSKNQVFEGNVVQEVDINPPTKVELVFSFVSASNVNDSGVSQIVYRVNDINASTCVNTKLKSFDVSGFL